MLVSIADKMQIMDRRRTADGFLATTGRISKTGIYSYGRGELGLDGNPNELVKIYRPEDAVFSDESMASAAHRPLTLNHPPVFVDKSNWKQYSVGHAGGKVRRDGEFLDIDMLIMDGAAISAVEGGAMLSPGYSASVDMDSPGLTPEGEHYDGIMNGPYKFNHIAVLTGPGRGGAECRLGDAWPIQIETTNPPKKETPVSKTILVDGIPVKTEDADAVVAAFNKLTDAATAALAAKTAAEAALTDAAAAHATALADAQKAHDTEMGQKDAKIADLEGKVLDQSAIDALATAKADIVTQAKTALGDKAPDFAGKSVADVRRATVAAKFGDASVEGKSDDYVEARFDALIAVGDGGVVDALRQSHAAPTNVINLGDAVANAAKARQEMIDGFNKREGAQA